MKQQELDKAKVMADPTTKMLANYVTALSDLAQPKSCIPLLHDQVRLDAFQAAIDSALNELPGMSRLLRIVRRIAHYQCKSSILCAYDSLHFRANVPYAV